MQEGNKHPAPEVQAPGRDKDGFPIKEVEVKDLEITIKCEPKEIAALVVGLQGRQIQPISPEDLKNAILARLESKDLDRRAYE